MGAKFKLGLIHRTELKLYLSYWTKLKYIAYRVEAAISLTYTDSKIKAPIYRQMEVMTTNRGGCWAS